MFTKSKYLLGLDVVAAITKAKIDFEFHLLQEYDGLWIPQVSKPGSKIYEVELGKTQRLLFLAARGELTKIYFSDTQYGGEFWYQVTDA